MSKVVKSILSAGLVLAFALSLFSVGLLAPVPARAAAENIDLTKLAWYLGQDFSKFNVGDQKKELEEKGLFIDESLIKEPGGWNHGAPFTIVDTLGGCDKALEIITEDYSPFSVKLDFSDADRAVMADAEWLILC